MKMVYSRYIDGRTRVRVYYLRRIKGMSVRKTAELCNISRGGVCRRSEETQEEKSACQNQDSNLKTGKTKKTDGQTGVFIAQVYGKTA